MSVFFPVWANYRDEKVMSWRVGSLVLAVAMMATVDSLFGVFPVLSERLPVVTGIPILSVRDVFSVDSYSFIFKVYHFLNVLYNGIK